MSRRGYIYLPPVLTQFPLTRSSSLGSRYPPRFVPGRARSIFSTRAGQLPVARLYRRRNEVIRRNDNGAQHRAAVTGYGAWTSSLHSREARSCARDASGRCSYHLLAKPYHSPGHHSSTLARSSATHPVGVIIPSTPRSLDLALSLSLWSCQPNDSVCLLLFLCSFPLFVSLSHMLLFFLQFQRDIVPPSSFSCSSYSRRHDRVFFSCA